jgi:hypothetical protein
MLGLATASFRFDSSRTLIRVNATLHELLAKEEGEPVFAREHFEAIHHDNVEVWADKTHIAHLKKHGFDHAPTGDIGAINFEQEMKNRYMDTAGEEPSWTEYCGYDCMTARLTTMNQGGCGFDFSLETIGKTVDGYEIWVVKVGTNSGPEVLMAGNIHGDETTGGQLLQRWLWETCNSPTTEQTDIATTIQGYYMPMFNVDGFERNRRGNGNNFDLNRCSTFPFPFVS